MNILTETILNRLESRANNNATVLDALVKEQMAREIDYMLIKGWTADECFFYMRNIEEVSPDQTEEYSLARMRSIRAQVEARLTNR